MNAKYEVRADGDLVQIVDGATIDALRAEIVRDAKTWRLQAMSLLAYLARGLTFWGLIAIPVVGFYGYVFFAIFNPEGFSVVVAEVQRNPRAIKFVFTTIAQFGFVLTLLVGTAGFAFAGETVWGLEVAWKQELRRRLRKQYGIDRCSLVEWRKVKEPIDID